MFFLEHGDALWHFLLSLLKSSSTGAMTQDEQRQTNSPSSLRSGLNVQRTGMPAASCSECAKVAKKARWAEGDG